MGEHVTGRKTRTWYSVQIYRRYKTEQGEYRQTNSYALADLVQVSRIAELAEEWLNRRAERRAAPPPTKGESNEKRRCRDFLLHPSAGYRRRRAVDVSKLAKEAGFRSRSRSRPGFGPSASRCLTAWPARTRPADFGTCSTCFASPSLGRRATGERVDFAVHVRNDNREGDPPLVSLYALCGPGDDGSRS